MSVTALFLSMHILVHTKWQGGGTEPRRYPLPSSPAVWHPDLSLKTGMSKQLLPWTQECLSSAHAQTPACTAVYQLSGWIKACFIHSIIRLSDQPPRCPDNWGSTVVHAVLSRLVFISPCLELGSGCFVAVLEELFCAGGHHRSVDSR